MQNRDHVRVNKVDLEPTYYVLHLPRRRGRRGRARGRAEGANVTDVTCQPLGRGCRG